MVHTGGHKGSNIVRQIARFKGLNGWYPLRPPVEVGWAPLPFPRGTISESQGYYNEHRRARSRLLRFRYATVASGTRRPYSFSIELSGLAANLVFRPCPVRWGFGPLELISGLQGALP
jgi:hypothetical protein